MTPDEARRLLQDAGIEVSKEKRLGNDTGTQLKLSNGVALNVYDKGTFYAQGNEAQEVNEVLSQAPSTSTSPRSVAPAARNRKVFVVYGHDQNCRDQLEAMLRRWDLEPLILDQLPTEGQTVIEKLEMAISQADYGVVLATPDDEDFRAGHSDEKAFRARQNVVLELGMMLAKLGRKRVAILLKTQENMERPSDIQGLIYIPFKDDIDREAGVILAKSMSAHGYRIEVSKL